MLQATPKHIFSTDFVLSSDDQELAALDVSCWCERGEFELEGVTYKMRREGMFRGQLVLESEDGIVARATRPSAFRERFDLEVAGRNYTLKKPSSFSRRFAVSEGGEQVGLIAPTGAFTRRSSLDLPDDWPLPIKMFVFWLAVVLWNRQAA